MQKEWATSIKRFGSGHLLMLVILLVALVAAVPTLALAKDEHHQPADAWTEWTETTSLPDAPGKFYLANNVTLDATWDVPSGNTTLCLNGKTVSLATGKEGSLVKVSKDETLVLENCEQGGALSGATGTEGKGGAVLVEEGGTFELNGVTIKDAKVKEFGEADNKVSLGGGVYVAGTFHMIGGTVDGNTALTGDDVYVSSTGTFNVEGKAKATKVALADGRVITVVKKLEEGASLGVTKLDAEGKSTSGVVTADYSKYNSDDEPSTYIKSNDATYEVFRTDDSKEAQLAKKVTLSFDANGGKGSIDPITGAEGSKVDLPTNSSITRDNYTFDGWNTAKDGTGTQYTDGQKDVELKQTTLYAQWKAISPKTYTIGFDANGGKGTMKDQTVTEGVEITLSANKFTRAGYTFKEWNTKDDGTGKSYADEATATFAANTTLYAQWNQNTNTITFNKNADDATGAMKDQTVKTGEQLKLNANKFEREGYVFTGWNTKANGKGTSISDKATIKNVTRNYELYAQWRESETYTISFDANGGTGTMDDQTATEGVELTLTSNTFTRTGYTFNGWNTKADGTGTSYSDGAAAVFSADTTLYAQWTPESTDTLTVTFEKNAEDATGTMNPQTAKKGETFSLSANTYARSGYTFNSWNTKADGSGTKVPDKASVRLNANVTLYAQWSKNGSQGGVQVAIDVQNGAPQVSSSNLKEVAEALFSSDEKGQGAKLTLTSSPRTLDGLSDTEKNALTEFINRYKLTNGVVFDLSLSKQVGSGAATSVSNTSQKVSITVQVPEGIRSSSTTNRRTYYLLRVHDGQVSALAGSTSYMLTCQSDQFSTYAIAYRDGTSTNTGGGTNGGTTNRSTNGTSSSATSRTTTRQATANTGDSSVTGATIGAIAVVGVAVVVLGVVSRRKRKN